VIEPGLPGLAERDGDESMDGVRPSPDELPVRTCPAAGRTVTGGRYM
jgi:hypothetical protein